MTTTPSVATDGVAAESFLEEVRSTPLDRLGKEPIALSTGKLVHVGRLSVNQVLSLARIAGEVFSGASAKQMKELQEAGLRSDWSALLMLFEDTRVNQMLGVILGPVTEGTWTEQLDIADLTAVVEAIRSHNAAAPLVALFTGAVAAPSKTASEDSSVQPN